MYYDVESIRSRDDQLLTIMLMIFFELRGTSAVQGEGEGAVSVTTARLTRLRLPRPPTLR